MNSPRRVSRSLQRWIDHQNAAIVMAAMDAKAWGGIVVFAAVILTTTAYAPILRNVFGTNALGGAVCFLPAVGQAMLWNLWRGSRKNITTPEWIYVVAGTSLVQFFAVSLVTWSRMPGAAIFATLFIFTAAYHGHVLKVTLTEPFLAIGTALAVIVAAVLNHDDDHLALFSVLLPTGVAVELLAGTFAAKQTASDAEAGRLRAAVQAEILDRQNTELQKLSQSLIGLLGESHDINNAMTSVALNADGIRLLLAQSPPKLDQLNDASGELGKQVDRVRAMLTTAGASLRHVPHAESVQVIPVVEAVASEVAARFGAVRVTVDGSIPAGACVQVRGGAVSLHRVLTNLATNACEGDGTSAAKTVTIRSASHGSDSAVALTVEDDGPGFAVDALQRPIEGLSTSKSSGTGLGLYTSERLVRASGGTLERANRPEGGAVVHVVLPVAAA